MKVAETFARFIKHTEFKDVDSSVIEHIKKLTLKQVMGMLVGSAAPTSRKSRAHQPQGYSPREEQPGAT
jgi:hypothetical protein